MTNIPQDWEIIELFDSTNLTKEQVAAHFGVTTKHVKKTLMAQPEWNDQMIVLHLTKTDDGTPQMFHSCRTQEEADKHMAQYSLMKNITVRVEVSQ